MGTYVAVDFIEFMRLVEDDVHVVQMRDLHRIKRTQSISVTIAGNRRAEYVHATYVFVTSEVV